MVWMKNLIAYSCFQLVFDYNDQMKIPYLKSIIEEWSKGVIKLRYAESPALVPLSSFIFVEFIFLEEFPVFISHKFENCRADASGEVANQQVHWPFSVPKVPGRFYYHFGKPIETEGTVLGQPLSLFNYQM